MKKSYSQGFTLIELLIVMAILGVLAVVVLVAINPVQQLARTRDAGRKSALTQVSRALQSYYTSHGGSYLNSANCNHDSDTAHFTDGDFWLTCLKDAGEISTEPGLINYAVSGVSECLRNADRSSEQNGLCYAFGSGANSNVIIYVRLESNSEASKCTDPSNPIPFFVWSSLDNKAGLFCSADATTTGMPAPGHIVFTE